MISSVFYFIFTSISSVSKHLVYFANDFNLLLLLLQFRLFLWWQTNRNQKPIKVLLANIVFVFVFVIIFDFVIVKVLLGTIVAFFVIVVLSTNSNLGSYSLSRDVSFRILRLQVCECCQS